MCQRYKKNHHKRQRPSQTWCWPSAPCGAICHRLLEMSFSRKTSILWRTVDTD